MPARDDDEAKLQLDEIDMAIIDQLQEDGRRAYGRIGKAVGLSEAAVRQRVQRMTESGAIRIVAVTDPAVMGTKVRATIGVRSSGDALKVAETVAKIPEIDYVVVTAGGFDVLAEVQCRSDEHLLEILNEGIRGIPGVYATETFIYLGLYKQTYPWPPV
ncbi:MAG: AsnC family transcriptional regulator [Solirubrobacterales bacterium 70-9]|nr:MAG: AsnC family transcriptional regulator [Solirubrobacterales bacterium 70-9]